MAGKKVMKPLKGSALLAILMLLLAISPSMIAGQIKAMPSRDANAATPSEYITKRYLGTFGYESPDRVQHVATLESGAVSETDVYNAVDNGTPITVNVKSTLHIWNGTRSGYLYTGQFASSNSHEYSVVESKFRTSNKNQVTTITEQKITGSINYFMSATEKKTMGKVVTKQNDVNIQFSNASGNYYIIIHGGGTWDLDESTILDSTFTVDQNVVEPIGHYVVRLVPAANELGAKATVTIPNGTIIDPGIYQFVDQYRFAGYFGENTYCYYHLLGWYVWWYASETMTAWIISTILGWIVDAFLEPLGIFFAIIADILVDATSYTSTMDSIIMMYFEVINYEVWYYSGVGYPQLEYSFPGSGEVGYYTDHYMDDMQSYYLGIWFYIPTFSTDWPYYNRWHTDPWPAPSQNYWVGGISHVEQYGYGRVYYPHNVIGDSNDGYRAILLALTRDDQATIIGSMNSYAHGHIYLYGYSAIRSHLYVYVSYDYSNWYCVSDQLVYPSFASYIDCGSYSANFRYIAIVVYDDIGYGARLYVDSVRVVP